MSEPVDVLVVGGGLVGSSLAAALADSPLSMALVEPVAPGAPGQPSFDERCTALSPTSRSVFQALGIWPAIAAEAAAIRHIHVSEQGSFGFTRLEAADHGLDALGHVVPNRCIGAALAPRLAAQATEAGQWRPVTRRSMPAWTTAPRCRRGCWWWPTAPSPPPGVVWASRCAAGTTARPR